jgi:protein required for attachment to host cells
MGKLIPKTEVSMTRWILVANSSFAEIFSLEGRELTKVKQLDNPEGRLKSGEILTDRPGRGFASGTRTGGQSNRRSAYSSEVGPHQHEQQVFAHKIADMLRQAKGINAFDKLDIIAPPQFLGDLRKVLPLSVRQCVDKEINKDISSSLSELERLEDVRRFLDIKRPLAV